MSRSAVSAPVTGRWLVDATRSTLRVSVKVGLLVTVSGTFADVRGHVDITDDPAGSRVDVTVGTASLSSGSACMDSLLHGSGVIDSVKNPAIAFVSRALRPGPASDTWLIDGLLATDSAVLDVTLQMRPSEQGGCLLFHAHGTLPSRHAVRLLSQPGVEKILGSTMKLDLTVTAVPA